MRKLVFKGGYGEHGRSYFLVRYSEKDRYYMVDCGIMDSDAFPYPEVTEEEIGKVDYLFLTHCHKDHTGAVEYILEKGFRGWIVASGMTMELGVPALKKVICLPAAFEAADRRMVLGEDGAETLEVVYGRSGHCPGGLWFEIRDLFGSCFFSGDYQADTLLYACDRVQGMQADIAVVDCAHFQTGQNAAQLRAQLLQGLTHHLEQKHPMVLPVPKYGRGPELLCMLQECFPTADIKVDTDFAECTERMLQEDFWYQETGFGKVKEFLESSRDKAVFPALEEFTPGDFDILLLADTHLQKEANREYVKGVIGKDGVLVITGRMKAGSLPMELYEAGMAERYLYPHHQSRGDMLEMIGQNGFCTVYPYHNPLKEVYDKKTGRHT
ncbi:MAG: MBL fold metallo-hydrolase [Lachnospiraceae bacterium]|nr:MBL fold metallo-hydrolase [Lachnospiraceae bacterium]